MLEIFLDKKPKKQKASCRKIKLSFEFGTVKRSPKGTLVIGGNGSWSHQCVYVWDTPQLRHDEVLSQKAVPSRLIGLRWEGEKLKEP